MHANKHWTECENTSKHWIGSSVEGAFPQFSSICYQVPVPEKTLFSIFTVSFWSYGASFCFYNSVNLTKDKDNAEDGMHIMSVRLPLQYGYPLKFIKIHCILILLSLLISLKTQWQSSSHWWWWFGCFAARQTSCKLNNSPLHLSTKSSVAKSPAPTQMNLLL